MGNYYISINDISSGNEMNVVRTIPLSDQRVGKLLDKYIQENHRHTSFPRMLRKMGYTDSQVYKAIMIASNNYGIGV